MKKLFLFLVFSTTTGCVQADVTREQSVVLDRLVAKFQTDGAFPAVSVLIDQSGETIYVNTSGHADLEHDLRVDEDSAYAIGSITKSFTALATLILVDRDKIDLDAPLSKYLPDYQGPAQDIEVRHLLSHTSGIPNYTGEIPGVAEKLKRTGFTRKQMVAHFEHQPLRFTKGEKFSYTNSGYYLLGLIIESVSGQTYYEFLADNIFKPFGMTRTYDGDDSEIVPGRVSGYALDENGQINASPWSHLVPFSAGSLVSTLADLVKYRRGVFHHPDFKNVRKLVVQQNSLNDGTKNLYALGGLIISAPNGHNKVSHSGDIWGFASNHAYYPDEDITIVILTNRQAEAPSTVSLEQKLARVLFGVEQPVIKNLTLPQEKVAQFAGDYALHPFLFGPPVYGFIAREGHLYLRFGGVAIEQSPMIPMLAQGDGKFVASFDDEWVFRFSVDGDGTKRFESDLRDGTFFGSELAND